MMWLSLPKVKTRLLPKQTQRLLRQLPRPQLSNLCFDDDDDGTTVEDLDLHAGYRRPEVSADSVADDLPDHVLDRLRRSRLAAVVLHMALWTV